MERGENLIEAAQQGLKEETGFCGELAKIVAMVSHNPLR
jgi:hypothetical protein